MTIFQTPTGSRVWIFTGSVSYVSNFAKSTIGSDVGYWATATDDYKDVNGVKRRRFMDTSIPFEGQNEIWLSDSD